MDQVCILCDPTRLQLGLREGLSVLCGIYRRRSKVQTVTRYDSRHGHTTRKSCQTYP